MYWSYLSIGGIGAAVMVTPAVAADADHGRRSTRLCAACHSEKPEAIGPSLKGVIGRKSGALEDFRYSPPMRRFNLTWDKANLRAYIMDSQAIVKGNRMSFGGLGDANGVDDVIAHLKTLQ